MLYFKRIYFYFYIIILFFLIPRNSSGSEDEERLMQDIFKGYNSLIRPIQNDSDGPLVVRASLQLVLLINVDEKDQIMQTNVWLTLKWHDFQMKWNPIDYGNIQDIRVSPDKVWVPDIVLFNNADGNYEVSFMCNVVINHRGDVLWVPPAIYKSSCIIDVEYFPMDQQICHLIFGSWTYNENEITLDFDQASFIDLSEYSPSSIWDVLDAPAALVKKRSRIEYQLKIRRKTLFYTVVLIIPTVVMAFISMSVFFLPTESTEKITLTTSVLLSIVVFLLLVSKILPPTSSTIPLMAKYLLLTFVLNVITILITVIIINVYFRAPTTHRMPKWVRVVFLEFLPKFICMKRPKQISAVKKKTIKITSKSKLPGVGEFTVNKSSHHPMCPSVMKNQIGNVNDQWPVPAIHIYEPESIDTGKDIFTAQFYPLTAEASKAIDAIEYITDYIKQDEEYKMCRDDWKYVGMVIDRLLLFVFFGVTLGGTFGVLLSSPTVLEHVNQKVELERLREIYNSYKKGP